MGTGFRVASRPHPTRCPNARSYLHKTPFLWPSSRHNTLSPPLIALILPNSSDPRGSGPGGALGPQGIEPSSAGEIEAGGGTYDTHRGHVQGGRWGRLGRPDDPHSGGALRGVKSFVSWDSGPGVAARAFDTKQVKTRRYVSGEEHNEHRSEGEGPRSVRISTSP